MPAPLTPAPLMAKPLMPQPLMPAPLGFPILDLIMVFAGRDFTDRSGELERSGRAFDLSAQAAGEREQLRRGQRRQIALIQFRFSFAQLFAQRIDTLGS